MSIYEPISTAVLIVDDSAYPERETEQWRDDLIDSLISVLKKRDIKLVESNADLSVEVVERSRTGGARIYTNSGSTPNIAGGPALSGDGPSFFAEVASTAEAYFSTKGWDHSEAPARLYNATIELDAQLAIPYDLGAFLDDYTGPIGGFATPDMDAAMRNVQAQWDEWVSANPDVGGSDLGQALDHMFVVYAGLNDQPQTSATPLLKRHASRVVRYLLRALGANHDIPAAIEQAFELIEAVAAGF